MGAVSMVGLRCLLALCSLLLALIPAADASLLLDVLSIPRIKCIIMEPNNTPSTATGVAASSSVEKAAATASSARLKSEETDALSTSKIKTSLHNADVEYARKRKRIEEQIDSETRQLLQSLERKKSQLLNAAKSEHKQLKTSILQSVDPSSSSAGNCTICNAPMCKIAAAQCIGEGCNGAFCKSCLKHKIGDNVRCHCCSDVVNVMCPSCVDAMNAKRGWYQFDYCKNGCGFICPEHSWEEDCCVCGECHLCSPAIRGKCSLSECGRCGEKLCDRCDYKEGCMCVDR
eukprot:scaffold1310_cov128-Skeletonema_dohrnii-CCMP3373.AAC.16